MTGGPVLLAVDVEPGTLHAVAAELHDRYARHYRVCTTRSPAEALDWLEQWRTTDRDVALVLAGDQLVGTTGSELMDAVRHLHPHAKRALLVDWGRASDHDTGRTIFDSIARGRIDSYVRRPSRPPDELFHTAVSGLLLDWAEARLAFPSTTHVVGESWSGRAYELRRVLSRCALPHTFSLASSPVGRDLVSQAEPPVRFPLVVLPSGKVLQDPTNAEIAIAAGTSVSPSADDFDVLIVGAGPAGLSAAVYGASEGFSTLVVDEGGIGGQATSSSLIRNYLGFAHGVSGRRLAQRAYEQAWVFGAEFAFMQRVAELRADDEGLSVALADFGRVRAHAVLLATGAEYRRLGLPALEELNGSGVFYGGPGSEVPAMGGRQVYVLGGANSAGQAALYLARYAARVTIVVRAASLGAGMSHYLVQQIEATPNVDVRLTTDVVDGGGDGWLEHLVLRDRSTGRHERVEAGGLFIMIGATPRTDWLPADVERDEAGFVLTGSQLATGPRGRWPLDRPPYLLETSMPRVLAVGDVRHGAGRRVASAVGEGAVAVQLLHQLFAHDRRQPQGRRTAPLATA